jgi:predicted N-acetyltransferase YhbS
LIREAFWNLYQPGAEEHYIYFQIKRQESFVPGLCLVVEESGVIVGQIIAYRTKIKAGDK